MSSFFICSCQVKQITSLGKSVVYMYRYRPYRSQVDYIVGLRMSFICIGIVSLEDDRVVGAGESTSSALHYVINL